LNIFAAFALFFTGVGTADQADFFQSQQVGQGKVKLQKQSSVFQNPRQNVHGETGFDFFRFR